MNSGHRVRACLFVAAIALVTAAARADDRTTIKNNLLPGHFTEHRLTRTIHRTIQKKKKETLVSRQATDWVQLNLNEPKPGGVRCFQMVVDQPAKVVSLREGGKKVSPTPPPQYYGLSRGNVRLHSLERGPRDSEVLLPKCSAIEQCVMRVLVDFAHWPDHSVAPGQKWERDIRDGSFEGTQTVEFVELLQGKDGTALVLTMYVTGSFKGSLEKEGVFKKGQAIIHWERSDRTLLRLESRAEYERRRPEGTESFVMELNAEPVRIRTYTADEAEVFVDQLIAFEKADTALRKGDRAMARSYCEEYRRKWPKSVWMPALEELESRITPRDRAPAPMKTSEVSRTLAEALIKWEAARAARDLDIIDQTRRLLKAMCKSHGGKIRTLAKSGEDRQRAPAVFALAFSASDDDFYAVQKYARDDSAAVRAMALAGIAARRDKETSVELLLLVLDDQKANVRSRACDAVAACVSREHYSVEKIAARLGTMLIDDESRAVRLGAVRALAAIGGAQDVAKLEKGLTRELDDEIRREMKRAIKTLEKRG